MPDPIVSLNEESLKSDLRELVRRTVEEMLNGLLDEEADDLVGAERYERTADREAYRAGHYERRLTTTSGEVTIRMPKLKGMRFTTAIIERYRRRETSVEEAMIEMYLAGVSTRRIEDVSEILWGSSVSASTVSNLNEKAFASVEEWAQQAARPGVPLRLRGRDIPQEVLGRELRERRRDGGHRRERRRLPRGHRRRGGLHGVGRVLARVPLVAEVPRPARRAHVHRRQGGRHGRLDRRGSSPGAAYQRCTVHFYRNVLARVPKSKRPRVAAMLKAIHAMESREAAEAKALEVASELEKSKLREAAMVVRDGCAEDADLHQVPPRALAPHTHQQRHRAPEPGDPQAHPRGRYVPRREERPHARDREAQVRRRERVGLEALPGRDAAGRGSHTGGRAYGAVGKCARILTVPRLPGARAGRVAPRPP